MEEHLWKCTEPLRLWVLFYATKQSLESHFFIFRRAICFVSKIVILRHWTVHSRTRNGTSRIMKSEYNVICVDVAGCVLKCLETNESNLSNLFGIYSPSQHVNRYGIARSHAHRASPRWWCQHLIFSRGEHWTRVCVLCAVRSCKMLLSARLGSTVLRRFNVASIISNLFACTWCRRSVANLNRFISRTRTFRHPLHWTREQCRCRWDTWLSSEPKPFIRKIALFE